MFEEIEPAALATARDRDDWCIVDVREDWERELVAIAPSLHIPLGQIVERVGEIPATGKLAMLCHGGMRSAQAAAFLNQQGRQGVYNISGGIDRWATDVDPSLPRY
ncbi:MAG: rhodanese-like domain-containing protein [Woeseiaceae bacterium]